MFKWISSNSCPLNLLLVRSHQAKIIITRCLIQGRNHVTRVRVESIVRDQGRRNCRKLLQKWQKNEAKDLFVFLFQFYTGLGAMMGTVALFTSGATSAATFSVAVAPAPLLFFVISDKRQRCCFFSQKSDSASAPYFKQISCRCRYC